MTWRRGRRGGKKARERRLGGEKSQKGEDMSDKGWCSAHAKNRALDCLESDGHAGWQCKVNRRCKTSLREAVAALPQDNELLHIEHEGDHTPCPGEWGTGIASNPERECSVINKGGDMIPGDVSEILDGPIPAPGDHDETLAKYFHVAYSCDPAEPDCTRSPNGQYDPIKMGDDPQSIATDSE
jgi:hypothetical protein